MATFETRTKRDGTTIHHVKIRLSGARQVSESFRRITDAKKWAQQTEVAIQEGRYFKNSAAHATTLAITIDRYVADVLPQASLCTLPAAATRMVA